MFNYQILIDVVKPCLTSMLHIKYLFKTEAGRESRHPDLEALIIIINQLMKTKKKLTTILKMLVNKPHKGIQICLPNLPLKRIALFLVSSTLFIAGCNKKELVEDPATVQTGKSKSSKVSATPGYYSIATYNVRRTTSADVGKLSWTVRRPLVKDMVLKYSFDIFGVQEPMGPQIDNMVADLPAYSRVGVSDHGNHAYQHQDIFYKTAKFTLKSSGKFWMAPGAPTTHTHTSALDLKPWDSEYHACVCTWAKFQDKTTGREFYVFNGHYDPSGTIAKEQSAILTLSKIQSIAGGLPSIFMGDLNSNQYQSATEPYHFLNNSALLDETWNIATTTAPVSRQTGNWWNINPPGDSQIDHIFVSRESHNTWDVLNRTVLWDHYDGVSGYNDVLPSDHFPVVSEMKLPTPATPIANGTYKITVESTGKAVVVLGASMSNSAELVQWFYSTADPKNDEWIFTKIGTSGYYRITNVKSGLDMNVQGASFANSAKIIQYSYSSDMQYNDEWFLIDVGNGYYRIVSRHSGLGLNVQGNSQSDGANIIQYNYPAGATNMHFKMTLVP